MDDQPLPLPCPLTKTPSLSSDLVGFCIRSLRVGKGRRREKKQNSRVQECLKGRIRLKTEKELHVNSYILDNVDLMSNLEMGLSGGALLRTALILGVSPEQTGVFLEDYLKA